MRKQNDQNRNNQIDSLPVIVIVKCLEISAYFLNISISSVAFNIIHS